MTSCSEQSQEGKQPTTTNGEAVIIDIAKGGGGNSILCLVETRSTQMVQCTLSYSYRGFLIYAQLIKADAELIRNN